MRMIKCDCCKEVVEEKDCLILDVKKASLEFFCSVDLCKNCFKQFEKTLK